MTNSTNIYDVFAPTVEDLACKQDDILVMGDNSPKIYNSSRTRGELRKAAIKHKKRDIEAASKSLLGSNIINPRSGAVKTKPHGTYTYYKRMSRRSERHNFDISDYTYDNSDYEDAFGNYDFD